MLSVDGVTMQFGGVKALTDVKLRVGDGQVVGVIGPNGSGKSTLINVMTGFYEPTGGRVRLDGREISGLPPEVVHARGVVRTFQNLRLVHEMSVLENTMAGLHRLETGRAGLTVSWVAEVFGGSRARGRVRESRRLATEALDRVGLADRLQAPVGSLSYADQKRVEMARAIALRPRVLVLDEPTAGMSVEEADELLRMVVGLVGTGEPPLSLFLVEHRLELVLEVSDRVVVMDGGVVVADGLPVDVAADPEVRRIYVGGE